MIARYAIDFSWRDFMRAVRFRPGELSADALWRELGFDEHGVRWTIDGRTALRLILRGAQLTPGEAVVVPRLTCEQVHQAITAEGGRLCFADIQPDKLSPSVEEYAVAQNASGARFVVAISYWGIPFDIGSLRSTLPECVKIIQDCALSFGSTHASSPDGALADAAIFSFGAGKPLCAGLGGAVIWRKSVFPALDQQLNSGNLGLLPCPNSRARRALVRARIKAMTFANPTAYRLLRYLAKIEPNRGRRLRPQPDALFGAPAWLESCVRAKTQSMVAKVRLRRERFESMWRSLAGSGCDFAHPRQGTAWNYWMCPILLPTDSSASLLSASLARAGFETRSPYIDELSNDASLGFDPSKRPNWLTTSSLDLLDIKGVHRFAAVLKDVLKDD